MKQYIITEKLLNEISTIDRYTTKMNNRLFAVRSRPYNPQAEREKVLKMFEKLHTHGGGDKITDLPRLVWRDELDTLIKELRGKGE